MPFDMNNGLSSGGQLIVAVLAAFHSVSTAVKGKMKSTHNSISMNPNFNSDVGKMDWQSSNRVNISEAIFVFISPFFLKLFLKLCLVNFLRSHSIIILKTIGT